MKLSNLLFLLLLLVQCRALSPSIPLCGGTLTELENASLSSDLPPHLAKKLKENHAWFVDAVSLFKPPNAKSKEALNSQQLKIRSHDVTIKPELKDKALYISSYLSLDEVQSYILVERSLEQIDLAVDCITEEYLHVDVDLFTLWAEEKLIEDSLVLDILFLVYYKSLGTCNGETWKKLCSLYKGILYGSYNFGKLAISTEALKSSYHAKIQLLLILIETLNLENLLQMVHDEIPFRFLPCCLFHFFYIWVLHKVILRVFGCGRML